MLLDSLTFGSLSVGGLEITPNRLFLLLNGFLPRQDTLSLTNCFIAHHPTLCW